MKSSPRNGAKVRVLALHTTEGLMSALALRNFFDRADAQGSSHAGADSTGLLLAGADDKYVDPARACWALRNGNPWSDNLEMCAFAGWTRPEWLARPKLLEAAAQWLADRHTARPWIPLRRLSIDELRVGLAGVIDHDTYTKAYRDGTHWDVGTGFPWDIVLPRAVALATGTATPEQPQEENDDMALCFITDGDARPWWVYDGFRRRYVGPGEPQRLVDLGLARQNMVKLIAPAVLAAIPTDVPVDEAAIAKAVTERWAKMTAEQRAKEEAHVLVGLSPA